MFHLTMLDNVASTCCIRCFRLVGLKCSCYFSFTVTVTGTVTISGSVTISVRDTISVNIKTTITLTVIVTVKAGLHGRPKHKHKWEHKKRK